MTDLSATVAVVTPTSAPGGGKRGARRGIDSELLSGIARRLGVTPIGLGLLAVALVGFWLGRTIQSRAVLLLSYGLAGMFAISWVLGRRALAITAERSEIPSRVREGRPVDVTLSMTAGRRLTAIVVEERLDDALGLPVRVPVPLLPAGGAVVHEYSFAATRRGVFQVGPLIAEWSDPFGLTQRRVEIAPAAELLVHPRTEDVADRILSRAWEDPPIRPPVSKPWPTGFEFYGMREYVAGDDPRRIIWRAVAKHDKYLVQESEQGITDRVHIVLDTDQEFHSPGTPSETFENGVRVAASLAVRHLKDGLGVAVDVCGSQMARNVRGTTRRIPLLDAFARIQPEKANLGDALDRVFLGPRGNSHHVVITPHISLRTASRLRLLLDRGTSVLLIHLMWDDTEPASVHRAGELGCNVVEVHPGMALGRVFQHVVRSSRR